MRVVVVTDKILLAADFAKALKEAGYDVLHCLGPQRPGYSCPGGRAQRCPLALSADAIVLDDDLETDDTLEGVPSWVLLSYYVDHGLPVIVLTGPGRRAHAEGCQATAVLSRLADPAKIVAAVQAATSGKRQPADPWSLEPRSA